MRVIFLWRINTSSGRSRFGSWIAPIMRMTAMEISTPAIQTAGYLISHVVTGMVDRAINTDRIKHPMLVLQWKPSEYLLTTTNNLEKSFKDQRKDADKDKPYRFLQQ